MTATRKNKADEMTIMEHNMKLAKENLLDQELLTRYFVPTNNSITSSGYILHYCSLEKQAQPSSCDGLNSDESNFLEILAEDEDEDASRQITVFNSSEINFNSKKRKKRSDRWRQGSARGDDDGDTDASFATLSKGCSKIASNQVCREGRHGDHFLNNSLEDSTVSDRATQCDLYSRKKSVRSKHSDRSSQRSHHDVHSETRSRHKNQNKPESNRSDRSDSRGRRRRSTSARSVDPFDGEKSVIAADIDQKKLGRNMRAKGRKSSHQIEYV